MTALEHLLGRYLSLRARSEEEVRGYLETKRKKISVGDEFVESLITKYKDLGYIDDAKYVEVMTHSLITNKAKGSKFLAMKLGRAGIPKEEIQAAIRTIPQTELSEAMSKRLHKYEHKLSSLEPKTKYYKSYQLLLSSGFSSSEVRTFLDEWGEKR